MDVSADLIELGRIPHMAVVCAGVKSILDIPKVDFSLLVGWSVWVVGYPAPSVCKNNTPTP